MTIPTNVWTPVKIGEVTLNHRIVLAPLTRGRASASSTHERTWIPNELMEQYYLERATPGGLMISEACPVSIRASGLPGIPGWFTHEQQAGWKRIVDGVHTKGAVFFAQLWHQGRNTHSLAIGQQPESASDVPIDGSLFWSGMPVVPFEAPRPMSLADIEATQDDFVNAAVAARSGGCDGVELHGGNGYLFDQFLHSNINLRDDDYGGTMEKRCRFLLETVDKVSQAIGSGRLGVRLTPFGLFNQTLGTDRVKQWTYLCQKLGKRKLAYVHLIEPRFDEFKSASEKALTLGDLSAGSEMSLAPFREALGSTKVIVAGGYGPDNFSQGIESGAHDLVAFGRFFVSNPDLVERLRQELPLYKWDRSRFYGPFPDNEIGYTVHTKRELASSLDGLKPQLAD